MSSPSAGTRVAAIIIGLCAGVLWIGAPTPVSAASFSCGRELSRVEKMICADVTLSRLDDRLDAAFKKSVDVFSDGAGDENSVGADLRRSQREWLAARGACADAECVGRLYRARVAVLEFHGRPGGTGLADALAGEYHHGGFMTLWLQVRDADSLRVAVSGAEPTSARWVCDITGFAAAADAGAITVRSDDGNSTAVLTLARRRTGLEVPDTPLNRATSEDFCGMGGSFIWSYARR